MSFYKAGETDFTRPYSQEVKLVFSALDCVLRSESVIYCSSELTSGQTLYQALRQYGLKTAADLRRQQGDAWFRTHIFDVNAATAWKFAEQTRKAVPAGTTVITPGPFSAPGWDQVQYLAYWEELLRTRVTSVWFNRNWEYSNGCAFEFAVALDAGLETFDAGGQALDRQRGAALVQAAIDSLGLEGFDTSKLRENLARLG